MMISNPLVSVIVPNYNYARYLDLRMKSILSQTYENYEIIILDDKSTDESVEIIRKYQSNTKVSKVIINKENSGSPFVQWRKGISEASGDIIWIAESDDTCSPFLLSYLVEKYVASDSVLAFCRSVLIDEQGCFLRENHQMRMVNSDLSIDGKTFITQYLGYANEVQNASSAIFSKKVAMSIDNGFMNFKGAGDWMFWIRMSECGNVSFINKELNNYRLHNNTTSSVIKNGIEFREMKKIFDWLYDAKYLTSSSYEACKRNNILFINSLEEVPTAVKKDLYDMWGTSFVNIYYYKITRKVVLLMNKIGLK